MDEAIQVIDDIQTKLQLLINETLAKEWAVNTWNAGGSKRLDSGLNTIKKRSGAKS
jgi:hypothetical protein